jgi:hypothetical protein
LCAAQVR